MKASSIVLTAFFIVGAVLVSYAGLQMMMAVNEVLARIPVVR